MLQTSLTMKTDFFLWTVSTYDLDDQEGLKNRSNNLFARLSEQEKQLSTMRPLAVGYFSRDPDAVSPHRRYRLNRIAERDKFLHAVMWDNPAGGGGEFCWSDLNHTQIANHTSSISFSYSSTPDLKLSEWDRDSFPIRTTVEEESMTGMGIVETELKESKVYYGTGYVALSTWAEEWWATNSWVMSWAPGADRLLLTPDKGERARVQIIPIHEGNLGRPNEICVQLRSYQDNKRHWLFSKETNFVLQVMDGDAPAKYKSPPKSVWEAPINVGKNLWKEIFG